MNALKEEWIEEDGSVYSVKSFPGRSDFPGQKRTIYSRIAIAFNIGKELADHIVKLHNDNLTYKALGVLPDSWVTAHIIDQSGSVSNLPSEPESWIGNDFLGIK